MKNTLTNGEMTNAELIVKALENLGGQAPYSEIYKEIERITGVSLTDGLTASIRGAIHSCSSDSNCYNGKDDIFYSVDGIGKGVWGLR